MEVTQPTHRSSLRRIGGAVPLAWWLIVSALAFVLIQPQAGDPATPLPWDSAGHYLRGLEVRDAFLAASAKATVSSLRSADLYPCGHPFVLGAWLFTAGESPRSTSLFHLLSLWSCVFGAWLCCRYARAERRLCEAGAVSILLATAPIVALSATFMVEPWAVSSSLIGLAALAAALQSPARLAPLQRVAVVALGISAPLLTKYNIGLPLAAAGLVLAIWEFARGRARGAWPLLVGTLIGLGTWALFLSWQHDGWRSFTEFARNRANSGGLTPPARIAWYARLYARDFVGGWPMGLGVSGLAALGFVRHRCPLLAAAGVALIAGLGALSIHPYLLDRNLVGPAALLAVPAGFGFATLGAMLGRRFRSAALARAALLVVALAAIAAAVPRSRNWERRLDDPRLAELAPLSRFMEDSFRSVESCRVLGTFNEFSLGWARILWRRVHGGHAPALEGDFPYPLRASREGFDSQADSAYGALARRWAAEQPGQAVVTIDVADNSRWDSLDYRLWNAWKRNEGAAVAELIGMRSFERCSLADGSASAVLLDARTPVVSHGEGWGAGEPWGRWALAKRAVLRVRPAAVERRLVLRVAAFEGLKAAQECTVRVNDAEVMRFRVDGPTWIWQNRTVPLPPSSGPLLVELGFLGLWPGHDGDAVLRALPFASVSVERGAASAP